jgi:ATP-dependent RNA helicase DHX29
MGNCPVINVPGRTFPVTPYFLEDVVELTRYKLDPHTDSPYVARNMRSALFQWKRIRLEILTFLCPGYGGRPRKAPSSEDVPLDEDDEPDLSAAAIAKTTVRLSKQSRITLECLDHHAINYDLICLLLENLCFYKPDLVPFSSAILIFLPSLESIRRLTDMLEGHQAFGTNNFLILPLHSTISNENQGLVFNVPRPGVRKIVISTWVVLPVLPCVL